MSPPGRAPHDRADGSEGPRHGIRLRPFPARAKNPTREPARRALFPPVGQGLLTGAESEIGGPVGGRGMSYVLGWARCDAAHSSREKLGRASRLAVCFALHPVRTHQHSISWGCRAKGPTLDAIVVAPLIAGVIACGGRALYVWLRGRAAIQIAQLNDRGLTRRVQVLPPGSLVIEQRADRSEVIIEVGRPADRRGGGYE
ncbi:hypothetical protein TUSST3_57750 [Streptomyces sp. TUS-ST3]|nr:hypothetical protein TUSST3_57750 [Streptomyces sp. TUS-ST3]